MNYHLVDVFTTTAYSGNSLPVFVDAGALSSPQMLQIAQELRHFEAIFVERSADLHAVRARVFDLFEELPFAGHPLIGGAAVLHRLSSERPRETWRFELPGKTVEIETERTARGYFGMLDQGTPEFAGVVSDRAPFAAAFELAAGDLHPDLPFEVVSTGLRYLILPLLPGAIERARVKFDLSELLAGVGARYAVLLDEAGLEIRHWNNDGVLEDIATGSAAGTIGAYRLKHGLAAPGKTFVLRQGRFTGRPSELLVLPEGSSVDVRTVKVGGNVAFVGTGTLEILPGDQDAA